MPAAGRCPHLALSRIPFRELGGNWKSSSLLTCRSICRFVCISAGQENRFDFISSGSVVLLQVKLDQEKGNGLIVSRSVS